MDLHAVLFHQERDIRRMQEVVGKKLLNYIPLVAEADDEVIDPMVGIDLEDVPKDWLPPDLDHRLGPHRSFFANSCAQSARKNNRFHSSDVIAVKGALSSRSNRPYPCGRVR